METVVYLSITAMQHHLINLSGDRKLPKFSAAYFYPTMDKNMALNEAVNRKRLVKDGGLIFVMKMKVRNAYLSMQSRFRNTHNVDEYVIHSVDLERFNQNIVGEIEVAQVIK